MLVRIFHRGKAVEVDELELETTVGELKERVGELTDVSKRLQKLVWKGTMLSDDGATLKDVGLRDEAKVYLVGSTEDDVAMIQSSQADRALRPFEDDLPLKRKYEARPTKSSGQPSKYCFLRTEALAGMHDEERAKELLEQLANDRGVLAVMKKHRWVVGALKEMYPDGKVGVDPVCVLGYNVNKGAEIRLRLRTDDLRGFRPYYKLLEVLYHELSHNVHSDHDRQFYDLMNQIKKEAKELDWTQSAGRSTSGYAAPATLPAPRAEPGRAPQPAATRVGGNTSRMSRMSAAQAAARAAELRLQASAQSASDRVSEPSAAAHVPPAVETHSEPASTSGGTSAGDVEMEPQVAAVRADSTMETTGSDNVELSQTLSQLQTLDVGDVIGSEAAMETTENRVVSSGVPDPTAVRHARETAAENAPAEVAAPAASGEDSHLELLTSMGFSDSVAKRALNSCAGDVEAAVNWIVSRGMS